MLHADYSLAKAASRREEAAVQWLAEKLTCVPRMLHQLNGRGAALPASELPDLAQDVALVVVRRLAEFHGLCAIEAWIYRICLLSLRSRRRRRPGRTLGDDVAEPVAPEPPPMLAAINRERCQQLHRAIDAVGGAEAEVLRARHVLDEGFETISARTGIGIPTLRTRYYRGLERLRDVLQKTHALGSQSP